MLKTDRSPADLYGTMSTGSPTDRPTDRPVDRPTSATCVRVDFLRCAARRPFDVRREPFVVVCSPEATTDLDILVQRRHAQLAAGEVAAERTNERANERRAMGGSGGTSARDGTSHVVRRTDHGPPKARLFIGVKCRLAPGASMRFAPRVERRGPRFRHKASDCRTRTFRVPSGNHHHAATRATISIESSSYTRPRIREAGIADEPVVVVRTSRCRAIPSSRRYLVLIRGTH